MYNPTFMIYIHVNKYLDFLNIDILILNFLTFHILLTSCFCNGICYYTNYYV